MPVEQLSPSFASLANKSTENVGHPRFPGGGEPTWEMAYFFPPQGKWRESDYLGLEDYLGGHIRVELFQGHLEVLPVPTEDHQDFIFYLLTLLDTFVRRHNLGKVSFSGIRVRLSNGDKPQFREPDIAFMKVENAHRRHDKFWEGADLVMEVVSGDPHDHDRDYVEKKREYAAAGIAEYWIIDPQERHIQVFTLRGVSYHLHGQFKSGDVAASVLLPGFAVAVDDIWAAGE